ncbi:MAG TPA: 2-hydroxy-3-oxopropionate reductase [Conexibacter sp.]|jgi:2-hydroxy-3-oxopropionate reductase|nr:2-hydroxy-3-oxopropionate reductase [Conexibacter sp.]
MHADPPAQQPDAPPAGAKPVVGIVGLGIMGAPMARNLLRAGFPLVVWNRTPARADALVADGAQRAASPRAVAERAAVTITMLSDSPDVEAVYRAPDGVLAGAASRDVLVDMSTIAPRVARELASDAAARGATMLDAPVSGGDVGAQEGTLSIMVGGDAGALARARPVLEVLGARITHVGPSGAGQVVKACNQVVVALTLEALGEALVLGSKAGVDPAVIVEALGGGLAASRVLEVRGPKLLARDFTPGFKLDLHAKDLAIVLATARELGVALPGTAIVDQLFRAEQSRGHGEADNSTVVRALERLSRHAIGGGAEA